MMRQVEAVRRRAKRHLEAFGYDITLAATLLSHYHQGTLLPSVLCVAVSIDSMCGIFANGTESSDATSPSSSFPSTADSTPRGTSFLLVLSHHCSSNDLCCLFVRSDEQTEFDDESSSDDDAVGSRKRAA